MGGLFDGSLCHSFFLGKRELGRLAIGDSG